MRERSSPSTITSKRRYSRSSNSPVWTPLLGPEMKSTGEVMGVGKTFGEAFAKAMEGGSVRAAARAGRRCYRCAMPTKAGRERGP